MAGHRGKFKKLRIKSHPHAWLGGKKSWLVRNLQLYANAGDRDKSKKHKGKSPLSWFGGKSWLAKDIELYTPSHKTYVEPFAGAAHVFFRKERSDVEVLNDMDAGLINFYRTLIFPDRFIKFQRMIKLTPYSRELFKECQANWHKYEDPVERAWAWYVSHRQAWNGMPDKCWSTTPNKSCRGVAASVARYLSAIEVLPEAFERLKGVEIENKDFRDVVISCDGPQTWFYADPPYVHNTRSSGGYVCEMSDGEHLDLVYLLLRIKGMCLLSGYDTDIYQPLESEGWGRKVLRMYSQTGRGFREENLWFSPNLLQALWTQGKCLELKT